MRKDKKKNSYANCWINLMLKGPLFTTEDMKKKKIKYKWLPQRNEMLIIYCIVFGFK